MTVEVRYLSCLGNNMYQYALGRIIAEELGQELRFQPSREQPGWADVEKRSGSLDRLENVAPQFPNAAQYIPGRRCEGEEIRYDMDQRPTWHGQALNLPYILKHGAGRRIVLHGYFQRTEYYHPYRDRIRQWFELPGEPELDPGERDVIVHIRRSQDMLVLGRALKLDFYKDVLSNMDFDRLYVCGTGIDENTLAELAAFKPRVLDTSALATLKILSRANRIVLANSTFSWWGAYLSDAEEIWFPRPVFDMWSPDRPEVDLEVPDDRYRYVDFCELETWRPFLRPVTIRLHIAQVQGERMTMIAEHPGGSFNVEMSRTVEPFATWLAQTDEPFGLRDIGRLGLSKQAYGNVIKVIQSMIGARLLQQQPGAIEAVLGSMGMPAGQG